MLAALRQSRERARTAKALAVALTAQARQPVFFREYGVEDTIDGRFDMVALHAWLVFAALKAQGLPELARALSDTLFVQFDEALRDLGVSDMGMGRRMKSLGQALNGRILAYDAADDEHALSEAIHRNVYRGRTGFERNARALAAYSLGAGQRVVGSDLAAGALDFGPVPHDMTGL